MIDKKSWENAIGRIYKTRGGRELRVLCVEVDVIVCQFLSESEPYKDGWNLNGTHPYHRDLDLMEMVRQSNFTKTDMKSCG